MSLPSLLFSVTSLSGFRQCLYTHLYETMTRMLDGLFERVAERFFLYHTPLLTRKTQCLLTHMYLYFLNPRTQKHYRTVSDYYLKKHLCVMTYANDEPPCYEYRCRITHRLQHFAYRLEIMFRALLPDMLSSLCQLESYPTANQDALSRFRLREIIITFQ